MDDDDNRFEKGDLELEEWGFWNKNSMKRVVGIFLNHLHSLRVNFTYHLCT